MTEEQKPLSERVRGGEFQVILLGEGIGWVTNTEALDDIADEIAALEQHLAAVEDEKYPPIPADGTALRELGKRLTELLDAEHWNSVEPLLFEIQTDQQAAIDAALESVAQRLKLEVTSRGYDPDSVTMRYTDANQVEIKAGMADKCYRIVMDTIGTNPLAEAQARIAELEATAVRRTRNESRSTAEDR